MSKRDWLLDQGFEGAILEPEYLDEAIIGISHDDRAVYSYSKLVDAFMKHDGRIISHHRDGARRGGSMRYIISCALVVIVFSLWRIERKLEEILKKL